MARHLGRFAAGAICLAVVLSASEGRASSPPPGREETSQAREVCEIISQEARRRALPESFLARLIWKESSFNPKAVSPVGAQGIAQFMPATAKDRGLDNPFEPQQALPASAAFLSDLYRALGNLGLAAAAYNAGEARVRRWLAGEGSLPEETRHYVYSVTGRPASDWTKSEARHAIPPIGEAKHFLSDCVKLASRGLDISAPPLIKTQLAERKPWGVQVAGSHSESVALGVFTRLKRRHPELLRNVEPLVLRKRNPGMGSRRMVNVRIGAESRNEADQLCAKLLAKGSACVVLKN